MGRALRRAIVTISLTFRWFEARKPHELYLSAMTWGELHRGVSRLPESERRSELTLWIQQLQVGFENRILAFDRKTSEG